MFEKVFTSCHLFIYASNESKGDARTLEKGFSRGVLHLPEISEAHLLHRKNGAQQNAELMPALGKAFPSVHVQCSQPGTGPEQCHRAGTGHGRGREGGSAQSRHGHGDTAQAAPQPSLRGTHGALSPEAAPREPPQPAPGVTRGPRSAGRVWAGSAAAEGWHPANEPGPAAQLPPESGRGERHRVRRVGREGAQLSRAGPGGKREERGRAAPAPLTYSLLAAPGHAEPEVTTPGPPPRSTRFRFRPPSAQGAGWALGVGWRRLGVRSFLLRAGPGRAASGEGRGGGREGLHSVCGGTAQLPGRWARPRAAGARGTPLVHGCGFGRCCVAAGFGLGGPSVWAALWF